MSTIYEIEKLKFINKLSSVSNLNYLSNYIKFYNNLPVTLNIDDYIIIIIKNNINHIFLSEDLIFDDKIFEICNNYIKQNFYDLYIMYKGNIRKRFNQPMINTKISIDGIEIKLNRENNRNNIITNTNSYNRINC